MAVEKKVAAGGFGGIAAALVLYVLGLVFKGDVPADISDVVQTYVPVLVAIVASYFAPHTERPDLATVNANADSTDDAEVLDAVDGEEE